MSKFLRLVVTANTSELSNAEEIEQRELDLELERALSTASDRVFLLDLHTTSAPGPAYIFLEDTSPNRAFALAIPVPIVLGLEEELPGTLIYYLSGEGIVTIGFEAGQNDDPAAVDRAEAAVWMALEASGVLARGTRPEVAAGRQFLASESRALPRVVQVIYRHAITPEDRFRMAAPGFAGFQRVRAGEALGIDRQGNVAAPLTGLLLMPLYQEQGSDGFFLVRPVGPIWLRLSAILRKSKIWHHLNRLPGVERHPDLPGAFFVDAGILWRLMGKLVPLLGFRKEGESKGRVMIRRRVDRRPDRSQ